MTFRFVAFGMLAVAVICSLLDFAGAEETPPTEQVRPCCGADKEKGEPQDEKSPAKPFGPYCYCLQEEVTVYPSYSLYTALRWSVACSTLMAPCPPGNNAVAIGPHGVACPEVCPGECQARVDAKARKSLGLDKPVPAAHEPEFADAVRPCAEIVHTDYVKFEVADMEEENGRRFVRAKVFLVKLSVCPERCNAHGCYPAAFFAFGVQVEETEETSPTLTIWRHNVKKDEESDNLFHCNAGSVVYSIVAVPPK